MKILIMTDTFPPEMAGGVGRVVLTQARALQTLGHQVQVLSTRRDSAGPADLEVEGVQVHRLIVNYPLRWQPYLSLYNPRVARAVQTFLRQSDAEVVHAHNVHAYLTYESLALAHRQKLPVFLTVHDAMTVEYQKFNSFIDPSWQHVPAEFDYRIRVWSQIRRQRFRYFPLRNMLIRRAVSRYVDVLISPSQALLDVLAANGISARRMYRIPNGINPADWVSTPAEREAFRSGQGLGRRKVILLAGRLNRAKGSEHLLRALPEVVNHAPEAVLLVLSPPGGYGESMRAIAESLGIGQYIRFAGWLSGRDLAAAYGIASVCVVPSVTFDTFPTVNLEAMAAGVPVVATCFGGSREVVIDGETGFIVNPLNSAMLADRIIRILQDDNMRTAMGTRAREHVAQSCDWLAQAHQMLAIYDQMRRTLSSTSPGMT